VPDPAAASTLDLADEALTRAVLESFAGAPSPRLGEVARSLVRHLHAFVSETRITEEEWAAGIDFLTRTGHITDERRQEFVLLSDVLGVSMLVIGLNHRTPAGATESTVFGPFFMEGAPHFANGDDLGAGAPGAPCFVTGRVLTVAGEPVAGARVDVWQADDDGRYDVQVEGLDHPRGRGRLTSDPDGRFWFRTVLPVAYPIPDDGPVGELLAAGGRGPMRPAHIHFRVQAPGLATLTTHVFAEGDEHLGSDAVFGVRRSLIARFERHEPGPTPDGGRSEAPFHTLRYDFVLAPGDAGDAGAPG
jgi:hydroxyquinol 1,2-dioxygenase